MTIRAEAKNYFADQDYRLTGRRLWQARRYLGYSRERISVELGIEPAQLRNIELGLVEPNKEILSKCSYLYGRPLDWFAKASKIHASDIPSFYTFPPSAFSKKDWEEFRNFREVSSSLTKKNSATEQIAKLNAVLQQNASSEEFHEALNTYDSSMKTGHVDILNALSRIGITTIFRPIGIFGVVIIQDCKTGILLSISESMSALRFGVASALQKLLAAYQNNGWKQNLSNLLSPNLGNNDLFPDNLSSPLNILLPKFLLASLQSKFKWTNRDLADPFNIYQASLRLQTNYSETVHALAQQGFISKIDRSELLKVDINQLKKTILEDRIPENIDCIDVWCLSQEEEGTEIRAKPEDVFVIKLRENASAGYCWEFDELKEVGFEILNDTYSIDNSGNFGNPSIRTCHAQPTNVADGNFELVESCPWKRIPTQKNAFSFTYRSPIELKQGLLYPDLVGKL